MTAPSLAQRVTGETDVGRGTLYIGALAAWAGLAAVVYFLFANVKTMDAGVGYPFLAVTAACAAVVIMTRQRPLDSVLFRPSALWILAFMAYFAVKLLLDFPDAENIKAFAIGTDGGVVFAFLLGVSVSILLEGISSSGRSCRQSMFMTLLFLMGCLAIAGDTFRMHFASVQEDIFLIENASVFYQRAGNFLILVAIVSSAALAQAFSAGNGRNVVRCWTLTASVVLFVILIALLCLTSQLVSSNTGAAATLGVALGTLVWVWRPNLHRLRLSALLEKRRPALTAAFRTSLGHFVLKGVMLFGFMICLGAGVLIYLNLDMSQIRLFGYEERNIAYSLISRLELLRSNFMIQFAYNPIFGNLRADVLTTGQGTYAHSLISMLSHLGIVGTMLFAAYIVAIYKESKRLPGTLCALQSNVDLGLFKIVIWSVVVVYAIVGTYFTWTPLWFTLGCLFSPLVMRRVGLVRGARRAEASRGWSTGHDAKATAE